MKITKILLPSAVVATTALFVLPAKQVQAFSTIGGSLPVSERWFRVNNAFADAASNNNTNPIIEEGVLIGGNRKEIKMN